MLRRNIRLHHADFPQSRKPPPHLVRNVSSNSTPPVSAKNKKLRHIPDILIARYVRPSLQRDQACQFALHPDQNRMSARLTPIKRKVLVAEPPVRPNLHITEFAEVVCVQLKQVSQDRLLLGRGRNDFDIYGWPLWGIVARFRSGNRP